MSILNRVEMKLNELSDPQFSGVGFSNRISVRERNGKWYIYGRVYPNKGDTTKYENVQKSTNKKSTQQNYRYIQNHLQQTLWDVSNTKKEYEKKIIDENKDNEIPYFSEVGLKKIKLKCDKTQKETYKRYEGIYNKYLHTYFKDMKVDKIKPSTIEEFQQWVHNEFGIKHFKNIRSVLSIIFDYLVMDETILINPMKNTKSPKFESLDDEEEIYPFSIDEMKKILSNIDEYIENSKNKSSSFVRKQLKNIIYIMFGSGIRSGELIGLEWKSVDFKNNTIKITQSNRDGRIKKPKTKSSIRDIPMSNESKKGLELQKQLCDECGVESDFVFVNQFRNMYKDTSSITNKQLKPFLESIGIEYRRLYNFRHTFATTMLYNHMDIVTVSMMLGHKDVKITYEKYVKGNKDNMRSVVGLNVLDTNFSEIYTS